MGLFDFGGQTLSLTFGLATEGQLNHWASTLSNQTLALRVASQKIAVGIEHVKDKLEIMGEALGKIRIILMKNSDRVGK